MKTENISDDMVMEEYFERDVKFEVDYSNKLERLPILKHESLSDYDGWWTGRILWKRSKVWSWFWHWSWLGRFWWKLQSQDFDLKKINLECAYDAVLIPDEFWLNFFFGKTLKIASNRQVV